MATNSLDGGTNYAFGGATTRDGTHDRALINNLHVTIDNIGRQVNDYLANPTPDPNALYVIWGGGNDLFDDDSAQSVTNTANRMGGLIMRLANAGARNFVVPNLPPLGAFPKLLSDPDRAAALDLATANYRTQLNSIVASVVSGYTGNGIAIHVYVLDVWLDLIRVLGQPTNYNFVNTVDPAQGVSGVDPDTCFFWDHVHPTTGGHYQLAYQANQLLSGQVLALAKATNISTRGSVGTGEDVLITGFIITGTQPKKLIVRALGPSLANFGISGALSDPTLTIVNNSAACAPVGCNVVATNDNWKNTQAAEISSSGFAPPNDFDSVIIVTLAPGSYSAVVSGKNGGTGIALVDLYELDGSASIFANLSTRGFVGTGDNVLVGGLIIGSGEPPVIVLRAIGPTLGSFGIIRPLQDPTLELHDANGALISSDNDWKDNTPAGIRATLLSPIGRPRSGYCRSPRARQLQRDRPRKEWDYRCRIGRSLPNAVA